MAKVCVIGSGNVGASAALAIAQRNIADIVIIDILGDLARGKALDMMQSLMHSDVSSKISGTDDFSKMKGSDIIVNTAGMARKPGMTRDDLLKTNSGILKGICAHVKNHCAEAILINVANPMDIMTNLAHQYLGLEHSRILGMGGVLDGMRLCSKILKRIDVRSCDIVPMVLGEHGAGMIPVPEYTTVNSVPITEIFGEEEIGAIIQDTIDGGMEIVQLFKNGSAYYAPGEAIAIMVQAVLKDEHRTVCACAFLKGEYGVSGVAIGVPVMLGAQGIEKVIELKLPAAKLDRFRESAKSLKSRINHG